MSNELHRLALANSGKLKLRAKALLAEGDPEQAVEVAVLLHDAARAEARAVASIESPPAETRLAAAIEECWCLLEGGDPVSAALVWGRLDAVADGVAPDVASSMRARLSAFYDARARAYGEQISRCKTLQQMRPTGSLVPATKTMRKALLRELDALLAEFPGLASVWWARYRIKEFDGDFAAAIGALRNARRLQPDNDRFAAQSLLVVAEHAPSEADATLATTLDRFGDTSADVCLLYALAQLRLARSDKKLARERCEKAARAAERGFSCVRSPHTRQLLEAARLLTTEMLAGRPPTLAILYRAGLGDLAISENVQTFDVAVMLAERAQLVLGAA